MRKLLILFCCTLFFLACSSPGSVPMDPPVRSQVERGRYLANSVAACGRCHSQPSQPGQALSGGGVFYDSKGEIEGPNITPADSGIKDFTTNEIFDAIKLGKSKNNEYFSEEVHEHFLWMSDEDTLSIVAYLQGVNPVEKNIERRSPNAISKYFSSKTSPASSIGYADNIKPFFKLDYGQYLVNDVAGCNTCHVGTTWWGSKRYLTGGKSFYTADGENVVPAIDADALKDWTVDDLANYLKTGRKPNGNASNIDHCPIRFYNQATAQDLEAMAFYLKSLK